MALTTKQRQHLKGLAHKRKPVVLLGNAGVTDTVIKEIDLALEHHELLKIRLPGIDREQRTEMFQRICEATGAEPVQEIGRMAILYRRAQEPRLVIPA
jgi:RNA-binding protein